MQFFGLELYFMTPKYNSITQNFILFPLNQKSGQINLTHLTPRAKGIVNLYLDQGYQRGYGKGGPRWGEPPCPPNLSYTPSSCLPDLTEFLGLGYFKP
jgi:hypothetical protein